VGYVISNRDWGALSINVARPAVHTLAEVALALVLFSDAARVNVGELRRNVALPVRLLGSGSPSRRLSGACSLDCSSSMFRVLIDMPSSAAQLLLTIAHDREVPIAYVTGLQMRRAAELYAGSAKTAPRDAWVLADFARRHADQLVWLDVSDELLAKLRILNGLAYGLDITSEQTINLYAPSTPNRNTPWRSQSHSEMMTALPHSTTSSKPGQKCQPDGTPMPIRRCAPSRN
jgi:hypothetical protein